MIHDTINVDIKNFEYPIYIGEDLITDPPLFSRHIRDKNIMIVTNTTLEKLYLQPLLETLQGFNCDVITLPDGEKFKTVEQWMTILDALANNGHHRDTTVITLGGGVIGDVGGFAAASYQRGVDFIQVPTTLLSQVDASIGGKTAFNHPAGKNFIGAFHQPKAVIIDINLLTTLPEREFNAGLAEIIKHAMICEPSLFSWLEKNIDLVMQKEKNPLSHAITEACKIKRDIVVEDEKEQGNRALLNLGHTFAHAIERTLNYGTWLHGEAVAAGLMLACQLSETHVGFPPQETKRVASLLKKAHLPTELPDNISLTDLFSAMQMDKKVLENKLRFILMKSIGEAFICENIASEELNLFRDKISSNMKDS